MGEGTEKLNDTNVENGTEYKMMKEREREIREIKYDNEILLLIILILILILILIHLLLLLLLLLLQVHGLALYVFWSRILINVIWPSVSRSS
jgi:hypothetical protein